MTACTAVGQAPPLKSQENCGLDVAYTTLRMFGQTDSLKEVAGALRLDPERRKLLSFFDLKQYFESRNLTVEAFKASSARSLVAAVPAHGVAIVRTQSGGEMTNPHFFILTPVGKNVVFFDTYSRRSHSRTRDDAATDQWLLNMTGECLVVTESAGNGAGLRWMDRSLELGEHSQDTAEVVARVRFRNSGEHVVRLVEPRGSCGCMSRIDWPQGPIGPGEMGEIVVHFDTGKLSPGSLMKQLLVAENTPDAEQVVIPIHLTLTGVAGPAACELSIKSLEFGRLPVSAITAGETTIVLTIPNDGASGAAKVDVSADSASMKIEQISDDSLAGPGAAARRLTYSIKWVSPPKPGEFRTLLSWKVTRPGESPTTLELPVTGEAYDANR